MSASTPTPTLVVAGQGALDPNHNHAAAAATAHLFQLLLGLTQPDTATIRASEQALKPLLKQSSTMLLLWTIVVRSPSSVVSSPQQQPQPQQTTLEEPGPHVAVRHVAAILLRKRLPSHYSTSFEPAGKIWWQTQVLQRIAIEPVRPVQLGLIGVAAAIAHVEGEATPAFVQFLSESSSSSAHGSELTFLLLQEMTETIGAHWKPQLPDLAQLFAAVLNPHSANQQQQHSPAVYKAAVQALGQLMSYWADDEDEIAHLAPLLPLALHIASRVSVSVVNVTVDEDFLTTVLDVLYELAYSSANALQPHVFTMMEFALHCLSNRDLDVRVRDAAALVIATTAQAKPKTMGKSPLFLQILDVLFQLMQDSPASAAGALFESNPAWKADLKNELHHHHSEENGQHDDDDDDYDDDAPTETSIAQGTLDTLACEIPKKYIWPNCWTRCVSRMSDATHPNARKAGVAALGVIAEGCAEPLAASLDSVLPYVLACAQDPIAPVRECACFCLGQMSEYCQPDILHYSAHILPIVFGLLDDASVAVQVTSCYVLEMFCERLEPTAVRPHLDALVRKLVHMLESTTKRSVQEMAVAALAATAVAAEEDFAPYVLGVANLLSKLMTVTDTHLFALRGRALECMGHMAIAVGRDWFRPYFSATMQCALDGLRMDSSELQEFAYAVFANLAKVMKDEFAPALPELVPHLLRVIDQEEGQLTPSSKNDASSGNNNEFGALDDSDDEEEGGQMVLHVRTGVVEVKKGAITAIGEMAAHTGNAFCPYLEECILSMQKSAKNWHPNIKSEVADALSSFIIPSIAAYHNGEMQWKKGDIHGPNPLSAHTFALSQAVLKEELELMNDDEKTVASKACEACQSVIELCGPHAMAPVANDLINAAHAFLTKTAPCYSDEALYGELPDEDDDHDGVMQAACDLVGVFGRVMGAHFVQYLPKFLPLICEYGKSSRPSSDRAMSVGCLSELAQELEFGIADHWQSVFLPSILAGLADEDEVVKRNALFCAGLCCEHLRERAAGDYPVLLQYLGPVFSLNHHGPSAAAAAAAGSATANGAGGDAAAACIDNAAAAVARMIMACPTHVPLSQVLPVYLRALPLKTDMTENETVYKCVLGLLHMNQPDLMANRSEILRIFNEATNADSLVDDEIQSQLASALQSLQSVSE